MEGAYLSLNHDPKHLLAVKPLKSFVGNIPICQVGIIILDLQSYGEELMRKWKCP